ncbi:MAG: Fe-S cluster assembly protein SufB, partial [Candidatus Hydrogenedentota bacterium]
MSNQEILASQYVGSRVDRSNAEAAEIANREYKYGWETIIEQDTFPPGLDEEVVRAISAKKDEPEWLTDWRLKAYRHWLTMEEPHWLNGNYTPIDYQALRYYSAPKQKAEFKSLDEVDPELVKTFERLGIPLDEQKRLAGVAIDAVFDSVSVATTHKDILAKQGVIFCSFSEAVKEHPELVRKYLGSVVPANDNFFAALNSAVFSDGSFAYIPKGVRCPLDLSTYFRINARETGQFERTLIIADDGAFVNYLEGCTAPRRDENQLHAAVVELIAHEGANINYSTVQNWYAG